MDPIAEKQLQDAESARLKLEQENKTLKEKLQAIEAPKVGADEEKILKTLCGKERGMRYHDLEAEMGWNFNRLKNSLDILKNYSLTRVTGGGEVPTYLEVSEAGVRHAISKGLI